MCGSQGGVTRAKPGKTPDSAIPGLGESGQGA